MKSLRDMEVGDIFSYNTTDTSDKNKALVVCIVLGIEENAIATKDLLLSKGDPLIGPVHMQFTDDYQDYLGKPEAFEHPLTYLEDNYPEYFI